MNWMYWISLSITALAAVFAVVVAQWRWRRIQELTQALQQAEASRQNAVTHLNQRIHDHMNMWHAANKRCEKLEKEAGEREDMALQDLNFHLQDLIKTLNRKKTAPLTAITEASNQITWALFQDRTATPVLAWMATPTGAVGLVTGPRGRLVPANKIKPVREYAYSNPGPVPDQVGE